MRTTKRTPNEALISAFGITTREAVANILDAWNGATDSDRAAGATWYASAKHHAETMAESAGIATEAAAAVIAHLSPRTSWARNVAGAYALIETGVAPNCIGANADRARVALAAEDPMSTLHGPKTAAFARNILGDEDAVTIDVWAVRIATGTVAENALRRVGAYESLARAYRLAARRVGVTPAVMQATTWVATRGRAN